MAIDTPYLLVISYKHVPFLILQCACQQARKDKSMALFRLTVNFKDVKGGTTPKSWYGDFDGYATADTKRAALLADIALTSDAGIVSHELAEVVIVNGTPAAGSNVFEKASASVLLNDSKKANFKLPSPKTTLFSGNALLIASTLWTDLMANFEDGEWQLSDGDHYVSSIKGARVMASSGSTNLPS